VIAIKNLDVFYGWIHAVKRASLHVDKGEIVALIGGNGAGKTTLLTTISGLNRPGRGGIAYNGTEISRLKPDKIVKMGISHVPEGRLIFKPLSVNDNLLLGAYSRFSLKNRAQTAKDLENVYGIFPALLTRKKQHAGTLSGGEQQMLAIGRALMANPKLLCIDEPSTGLAPIMKQEVFNRIAEIQKMGITVLLVEQEVSAVFEMAERNYVLSSGKIIAEGSGEDLLKDEVLRKTYLGL